MNQLARPADQRDTQGQRTASGVAARAILSVAIPVVVAAGFAATAWWVGHAELGQQEGHILTWPFLQARLSEHLGLVGWSMAIAVVAGLPAGVAASRASGSRGGNPLARAVLWFANLGQAVPGLAVLALLGALLGIGRPPAILALALYSLLPILRNTAAGLASVDPAVVEAARGMGLTPRQVLLRAELPLASPVIFAGLRTAVVLNVGTATLATFIGAGGLGEVITTGLGGALTRVTATGCILTVGVALLADWVVGLAELFAVRRTGRPALEAA
ncbi:MAG TPA: ABC transporter permease [Acidimicrobiales bacterium]|nr:ABC transporter permease [Acidimicrobiales bacterium]